MSQTKTWKLFHEHLESTTKDQGSNDVSFTFITNEDKNDEPTIKANRGLLSLLSPVFKSMFNNGMKESLDNNIPIKDADSKSFKLFIQYFYGMDPKITSTNIGPLSYLAEKYLVSGLQKSCKLFLSESISIDALIPMLESLHKYHQDKLFQNCQTWMSEQSSVDEIVNMFQSDAFMNTYSGIVNVLLSGFGSITDASSLWQSVIKWSETKGNEMIIKMDDNNDNKDDEKEYNGITKSKHNKLMSIRKHFPFYRLGIDIISDQVLPLKILNKDMALEILAHKSYGKYHQLAQYCMSHKPLYYPKQYCSNEMQHNFEFGKNKENVDIERAYLVNCNGSWKTILGNVGIKNGEKWMWDVIIIKKNDNEWEYIGISPDENTQPGNSDNNTWAIIIDKNRCYFRGNGQNKLNKSVGIKAGDVLQMKFDGVNSTFTIYRDDTLKYTFNNVCSEKLLYPAFYDCTSNTSLYVRNFKQF
eukprot:138764_1